MISGQHLGTALEQVICGAVRKLTRYLSGEVQAHLQDVADIYRFGGVPSPDLRLPLLADLERAIREKRVVHLRYHTFQSDTVSERDVEPHFLLNHQGTWMLVGWDHRSDSDRTFNLHRICDCQVLDRTFVPRAELQGAAYRSSALLTDLGRETHDVVLRFDAQQARYVRERTLHPSQVTEDLPDGGLVVRFAVAGRGDVTRWVLTFGSHVEVLEPSWLREAVHRTALEMAALYG